jgi:hypothetical protein
MLAAMAYCHFQRNQVLHLNEMMYNLQSRLLIVMVHMQIRGLSDRKGQTAFEQQVYWGVLLCSSNDMYPFLCNDLWNLCVLL